MTGEQGQQDMDMSATIETEFGLLQQLSNALAGAVAQAGESVVRVNARRRLPATGIAWSADTVITANHVVEHDEGITISTPDGRELPARIVGRDQASDLAVLKVEGGGLTPAIWVRRDEVAVGALALALGRATELAATNGVVSAVGGSWERNEGRRPFERLIATDAPLFPGFSGGPLIDPAGRVLGLLSSHLGRHQSLAIPYEEVERVVTALQTHGRVRNGYLGIGAQPVELPAALRQTHGLTQERGLLLVTVDDSGPAGKAGITIGDIVLSLGGEPVQGLDNLRSRLGPDTVGKPIAVRLLRGGQPREFTVTVGERN
jgi:S1-C subfamily serine protease